MVHQFTRTCRREGNHCSHSFCLEKSQITFDTQLKIALYRTDVKYLKPEVHNYQLYDLTDIPRGEVGGSYFAQKLGLCYSIASSNLL